MAKTPERVTELLKREIPTNISLNKFCKQTGINPNSVDKYMAGTTEPTQASLQKLADYFGVAVGWLRGEETYDAKVTMILLDRYFEFIDSLEKGEIREHGVFFTKIWFDYQFMTLQTIYNSSDTEAKPELEPYLHKCAQLEAESINWSKSTHGLLAEYYSNKEKVSS